MIKTVRVPSKQIALLSRAQALVNKAQNDLDLIAQTILAGLESAGSLVSVDTEKNTVDIELPE